MAGFAQGCLAADVAREREHGETARHACNAGVAGVVHLDERISLQHDVIANGGPGIQQRGAGALVCQAQRAIATQPVAIEHDAPASGDIEVAGGVILNAPRGTTGHGDRGCGSELRAVGVDACVGDENVSGKGARRCAGGKAAAARHRQIAAATERTTREAFHGESLSLHGGKA